MDFIPFVRAAISAGLPLDPSESWRINIHQNRTHAATDKPGPRTPEGVHQDGHEFVEIAVLRRHNVVGGEMRLWHGTEAAEPFWRPDQGQPIETSPSRLSLGGGSGGTATNTTMPC